MTLGEAVLAPRIIWGEDNDPGAHSEIFPPITEEQIVALGKRGYRSIYRAHVPTRDGKTYPFRVLRASYETLPEGG